ncbi:phosphoribosylformylglycinamidine cyclo-ligase [Methanococcus maripaludis]|uniref:Phosphoribosylformylglycinamidine cyclo-ligase n=2 Tax=Methanococcus maripaludis TaxID=39152 RepID=PUR5_METM7|nr:phosphoribosylformylglycinamidine cyclo-ligase [Methanococcus maripaludis]A6VGJ3.1 RecName: Full=Phosphoribosylformylglycinamidine cyclo-ligase; AltName: Full=AIR synthase; AltName: Full=AIRS; AltName: Full=Phosphoribosyl-aminoimidazole synthetase [Methanococcus maripaludis C7]MBA2861220.1 phosphoribosylformylglycinamidine cyclo-ligase [Methanococcus maripaludis]
MVTYKDAGVDIYKEDKVIRALASQIKFERTDAIKPADLKGHYAGAIEFGDYYLVLCTDGVGSKMVVAEMANKFDTVPIDMIAMNVNDAICIGAEPVALVDYMAVEDITEDIASQIGKGLNDGIKESNINLIGGETASLPNMIKGVDLAGTVLAVVKKDEIVSGKEVKPGNVIVGLRSSGIHSNGLSLARKVFFEISNLDVKSKLSHGKTVAEELLTPTKIYVKPVLEMIKQVNVKGLAHITGGGFRKLKRLNKDVCYKIDELPEILPIFKEIQNLGNVADQEMFKTFNMGIGFCVIVEKDDAEKIIEISNHHNIAAFVIGKIEESVEVNGETKRETVLVEYNNKKMIME